jgi:hypothetical protein
MQLTAVYNLGRHFLAVRAIVHFTDEFLWCYLMSSVILFLFFKKNLITFL